MGSTTVDHLIGYMKLGGKTLLRQKTSASFEGETTAGPSTSVEACHESNTRSGKGLAERCLRLLSEQKKSWQDLREGCASLTNTREREVPCSGFSVRLQYNPGRIKSSTADVDAGKVNERRCFLCLDHLPEGQKGILYRGEYLILCNPMPVFFSHFTIPHVDHRRQAIVDHVDAFLHLMADLGGGWTVLYNGPRCGASAPDHLHFQAGPSEQMPIGKEIREEERLTLVGQVDDVLLYRVRDLGREVLILEGDNQTALEHAFKIFMKALQEVLLTDEEPLLNVAGFFSERSVWRLVIFPRRKHRPDVFYQEGHARRVISPGVIDMGGLLITPVEKDFEELDAPAVEGIYREVSLGGEVVERAIEAMGRME
jgi:hypothetical protein